MKGLTIVALGLMGAAWAQEGSPRTEVEEARLALTNVLIQEVKSGRQATFSLKWDYLPESKGLKDQFLNVFTFDGKGKLGWEHEYSLPNEALRDPERLEKWFAGLKDRETLALALSGGTLRNPASLADAIQSGMGFWDKSLFTGLGFAETGNGNATVPWANYISAKRDFFSMRALLADSKGAGAVVEFTPQPRGENPLLLSNGLVWKIRVFPLPTTTGSPLYRFSVSIQSKTISKLFDGTEQTPGSDKPRIAVTVGLLKEDEEPVTKRKIYRMAKVSLAKDGTEIATGTLPGANKLQEVESTLSPSVGATALDVFAGASSRGLLGPLISNNSEAKLFTGGLIGQGKPVTVYGMNYIFTDRTDGNLGFAYAFVPKSNSGLYLGPSLSIGPFIFSVGAQLINTKDDTLSATLGGTISIDLAKVFDKPMKATAINPKLVQDGSEIWADTDALFANRMLVLCRVQGADVPLMVTQVRDASGATVKNGGTWEVMPNSLQRLVLPRGYFTVTAPAGFEMVRQAMVSEEPLGTIPDDVEYKDRLTLTTVRERAEALNIVVRPKSS